MARVVRCSCRFPKRRSRPKIGGVTAAGEQPKRCDAPAMLPSSTAPTNAVIASILSISYLHSIAVSAIVICRRRSSSATLKSLPFKSAAAPDGRDQPGGILRVVAADERVSARAPIVERTKLRASTIGAETEKLFAKPLASTWDGDRIARFVGLPHHCE
jgi:hypothetical protein